jgi:hypothetical protein
LVYGIHRWHSLYQWSDVPDAGVDRDDNILCGCYAGELYKCHPHGGDGYGDALG